MNLLNLLCVDIGSSNIKIIYGRNFYGKLIIHKSKIISTPTDSFTNGYINNQAEIAEKIKKFITDNKLKAPKIAFSVHSSDILIRNMKLPMMSKSDILKSIEWEIGHYMKGSIKDYHIGYDIHGKENKQLKIFFVVVPKKIIDQYEGLAKHIGTKIKCIEIASICASRFQHGLSKTYAIMDFGHESVRITLYEGNYIFADRELLFKKANSANNTRDLLGNFTNGSTLLKHATNEKDMDSNSESTKQLFSSIWLNDISNKNLENVFKNLSQMTDYYLSLDANHRINGIYASGGLALDTRVKDWLKMISFQSSELITDYKKIHVANKLDQNANIFVNAIGLLLRV